MQKLNVKRILMIVVAVATAVSGAMYNDMGGGNDVAPAPTCAPCPALVCDDVPAEESAGVDL